MPWVPHFSRPMISRISATLSPMAGVGARDRSTTPKGTFSRFEASRATSWPMRVILKAVFFTVSATTSKGCPLQAFRAWATTPGPETPTLMTHSGSPTPWKAPAIKGLSSTALAKTTSFAQPMGSMSAVSRIMRPIRATASILMPERVEATFTLEQTRSVWVRAVGMERIRRRSLSVKPFWARAEKPPIKFTPTAFAALSSVRARGV